MKRIDVVKKGSEWVGRTVSRGGTETEAVQRMAAVARVDAQPVTVKIHKENGRLQEERTYPPAAHSRRSKA